MAWTYSVDLALGGSQTGLSLRAALCVGVTLSVKDVATGFTERGAGVYNWTYAAMPDGFQGDVVFYTGAIGAGTDFTGVAVKAGVGVNPGEAELPGRHLAAVDGKALYQALQILGAVVAGKVSGAGTGTEVFVGLDGVTVRVTVHADNAGNRSAVTYG
jgi:hypothetical protein